MGYGLGVGQRAMFGWPGQGQPGSPWQGPMMPSLPSQAMVPQMPTLPAQAMQPQMPASMPAPMPVQPMGQPDPTGGAFASGQFMPPGLQGRTDMPSPWASGSFMPQGLIGNTNMPTPFASGKFMPRGLLGA